MNGALIFNWLDCVFIIFALSLLIMGCLKGFASIFLGLLSFVVSGVLAAYVYPFAKEFMQGVFAQPYIEQVVAATLSYLVILLTLLVISQRISEKIKGSALSNLNRIAGAVLGLIQGLLLPVALCLACLLMHIDYRRFDCLGQSMITRSTFDAIKYFDKEISKLKFLEASKESRSNE